MSTPTKLFLTLLVGFFSVLLFSGHGITKHRETTRPLATKIRIANNDGEAVIVLYANPVSRDFASLLPMSVAFRDYAGEEKIADLPRKLTTKDGQSGDEAEGDLAYFAPWGNLAVFYKGFGKARGLYILGRIESGKEWLANRHEDFTARIEIIE